MIEVKHDSGDEWVVTIQSSAVTHHRVRVTQADVERFGANRSVEDLLRESFVFLLERESNSSILSSFDLPLIGHYFPEYEEQIHARLRQKGTKPNSS